MDGVLSAVMFSFDKRRHVRGEVMSDLYQKVIAAYNVSQHIILFYNFWRCHSEGYPVRPTVFGLGTGGCLASGLSLGCRPISACGYSSD